ncbi:hypothetical protein HK100_003109 [Physocladia obscura]|uniref:N-acetyltransferase domain-containing protein n=1 Tax=Physocladia obscura TaxID=109957 RepID=A0AAD5T0E7_9FUNG|nr:hypothetical protein HK100_003109 [Physocladia obscura]
MSSEIRLVLAAPTQRDITLITTLRRECGWFEDLVPTWFQQSQEGTRRLFFIVDAANVTSDEPIGMISLLLDSAKEPDMASFSTKTGMVQALFVRPEFEGRGVGKLAMRLLEEYAIQSHGIERLTLVTTSGSAKTMGFYARQGYYEFKARVPPPTDWTDALDACFMKNLK